MARAALKAIRANAGSTRTWAAALPRPASSTNLPLFHEHGATLFDYLPASALLLTHGDVADAARHFADDVEQRYKFLSHDPERPLLTPKELFIEADEFFIQARQFGRFSLPTRAGLQAPSEGSGGLAGETTPAGDPLAFVVPDVAVDRRAEHPLARLTGLLERTDRHVLVLAESAGRLETLTQLFEQHQLKLDTVNDWAHFQQAMAQPGIGRQMDDVRFAPCTWVSCWRLENTDPDHRVRAVCEQRTTGPAGQARGPDQCRCPDPRSLRASHR